MPNIYMLKKNTAVQGRRKKFLGFFVALVVILGLLASVWFVILLLNPLNLGSAPEFTIEKGAGVNQISRHLRQAGFIRSSFVFETYVYLKGYESGFIAGDYELPSVVNIKRLIEILTSGQKAKEWEITVIEGWSAKEIAAKLESSGRLPAALFLEVSGVGQPGNKFTFDVSAYDFLADKPVNANLEGYLFPDTYRFFNYATVEDVMRKMLYNFGKKLSAAMRQEIEAQDKTIFDVVTMASIIEREVMSDEDRSIVAGIFWKRLDAGMALQADSTVNYITGKKTPSVSGADLALDSLYNTYKYPGLPPGPISNPGLSAIQAAIYPAQSDYWYFLTDQDGLVHYAKDFEEHKANKMKYLNLN